jgi:hypothetical protein
MTKMCPKDWGEFRIFESTVTSRWLHKQQFLLADYIVSFNRYVERLKIIANLSTFDDV